MHGWLETSFQSDLARALWAPWGLRPGLDLEAAFSRQMGQMIGFALEAADPQIVRLGAARMGWALLAITTGHGGSIRTGAEFTRVTTDKGRATGLELARG